MQPAQFFALLRTHVPPSHLETLMTGLTLFNKGDISKGELLAIATSSLGSGNVAGAVGAPSSAPLPDLVGLFKSLILRA